MAGESTITLVGNVTEPELRYTPSGAAACKFTVVVTPRSMDRQLNEWKDGEPVFWSCTAWRDLAEHVAESIAKGTRVIVQGRVRQENWEDKNGGGKRSRIVVEVDEIGPSLKWATAKVTKAVSGNGGGAGTGGFGSGRSAPADADPWATSSGPGRASAGFNDEPPF